MIFKRLGFALNSHHSKNNYKVPPFSIDMPELFERYAEVRLREKYKDVLIPGYGHKDGNSYTWGLRPDFIVKNKRLIIDAKYKYWFSGNDNDNFKDDFQQLSLYGREQKIREIIGLKDSNKEASILFVYPTISEKEVFEKIDNFNQIYKCGINIPLNDAK